MAVSDYNAVSGAMCLLFRALWGEHLAGKGRRQMMVFQVTLAMSWRQQLYKKQ